MHTTTQALVIHFQVVTWTNSSLTWELASFNAGLLLFQLLHYFHLYKFSFHKISKCLQNHTLKGTECYLWVLKPWVVIHILILFPKDSWYKSVRLCGQTPWLAVSAGDYQLVDTVVAPAAKHLCYVSEGSALGFEQGFRHRAWKESCSWLILEMSIHCSRKGKFIPVSLQKPEQFQV